MSPRNFTPDEDDFIRAHAGTMFYRDIARHLGRSHPGVAKRVVKLGLSRPLRRWSAEEDEALRAGRAAGEHLVSLAARLGRGESEVSTRCAKLGIKKPKASHVRGYVIAGYNRERHHYLVEHREVMARALGRPLARSEIVHHIDTVKSNNDLDNLYLCDSLGAHRRVHCSLERLLPDLLAAGIVRFNRAEGIYELCETAR